MTILHLGDAFCFGKLNRLKTFHRWWWFHEAKLIDLEWLVWDSKSRKPQKESSPKIRMNSTQHFHVNNHHPIAYIARLNRRFLTAAVDAWDPITIFQLHWKTYSNSACENGKIWAFWRGSIVTLSDVTVADEWNFGWKISPLTVSFRMPLPAGSWDAQNLTLKTKSPKTPKQTSGLTYLQWLGFTVWPFSRHDMIFRSKSQEVSHQISASGPRCTWSRSHLWGPGVDTPSLPCHHGSVENSGTFERYQPSIFQVLAVKFLGCSSYTTVFHIPLWPGLWALKSLLRPLIRGPNVS